MMDDPKIFELFSKELNQKLPVLISPLPKRTKSISKNPETRFILSNSIDESIPYSSPRSPKLAKKKSSIGQAPNYLIENELKKAIKNIISKKPTVKRSNHRKTTSTGIYVMKNHEENDINSFIKSIFSHEPSPYRKAGLTAEPKALDLRAAEKILQDAKKIIKHGVLKKSSHEAKSYIEDFWKNHIGKEDIVRWDIFEEGFLSFLENFMVSNQGILRKVNWKSMFQKIYNKLVCSSGDISIWPAGKGIQSGASIKSISFSDFAGFITEGSLHKILLSCIEELPFYIENLRNKTSYFYVCGCYYKGEWKDGKREGNGVFNICTGDKYFGNFISGLRQEFGTLEGSGYCYKGEFKKDKFNGYGVITYPNGDFFDGVWVKDMFYKGKYQFCSGEVYVGDWNDGEYEGRGKLVRNGEVKTGMWRGSKLCGDGSITDSEGNKVTGFFINDVLQTDYNE